MQKIKIGEVACLKFGVPNTSLGNSPGIFILKLKEAGEH